MKTRVLVVSNAYPETPESYHGIFIRRTVEELATRDYRSLVLVPRIYRSSPAKENFETHSVIRFPFATADKLLIEYEKTPYFRIASLLAGGILRSLRPAIRKEIEIIHGHWAYPAGLIASVAAKLTGKPLVITIHGSDFRLAAEKGGMHRRLFGMSVRAADHVICVSEQIAAYCVRETGIERGKITVQPVGVDSDIFYPGTEKTTGLERFTILSARNLQSAYRVADLIEAAARLTGTIAGLKLVLAGDGPERDKLERLALERGLSPESVEFTGTLSQRKLADYVRSSDLYVSTSPVDGMSASLLEALACGAYPVVTDIPANRSWLKSDNNGLLYPPADIESLSAQILQAYKRPDLRQSAAESNPELISARKVSLANSVDIIAQIYRKLAAK